MNKTIYININNEQIQSNEELEVLKHDLDSDFFFYLGEKIAKDCKVENENALITDFNIKDNEEDYKQIIAQWNELKNILFSEESEGKFELTLPSGYTHWLRYNEKYNTVYDRNFSHGEQAVITIDLKELYEDSVEDLQRKILRKLQRDDLYLEIDEIVFNDDAVTRKSPIILTIKEKYEGVGFKSYKKWLQDNDEKQQVCAKCKKNPCECNINPILSDSFFPYKGFTLGETLMNDFEDDSIDDGSVIQYYLDNGVLLLGATEGEVFLAAMVASLSSNGKLPKEWCNLLGCRFGTFREKCRRALNEKGFEIILDEDAEIVVVSPSKKYRIHLAFDVNSSKFVAILITLNACPYCHSSSFALRKINAEAQMHISYCTDCDESYLPFEVESEELDDAEDNEKPNCPNCSSDDVDDDGSDYLQYTCNDCGHNWGHDDTVECPECGSDDVENDGTDNMQYECNACGHMWGDCEDDDDFDDDADDYIPLHCPNCGSPFIDVDGSDYLQFTCNECYHNWGHDDTVECPECGSDDVENDGTDSMQYKCNSCGKIWGDYEYDDDTDNAGNQMSEYIESFDVIIGKSTKYDVLRKGGVLVNPDTGYGEYKMPNNIKVFFFNNNYTINHIAVHKEAANNIPTFYKQLGFYWGMPEYEFKQLFEGLGFYNVGKYDFKPEEIHAFKRCEKYNCTIKLSVQYDWRLGGMWDFSIDCYPPHVKCD